MRVVEVTIPPDKSISHRAIMLASISEGTTRIKNVLIGDDVLRTIEAFRAMGVEINVAAELALPIRGKVNFAATIVRGVGMYGLKKPRRPLYLGNSGTTMRILPGILAGQDFEVVLKGDKSLSNRPMKRIVEPLVRMGADISGSRFKVQGSRDREIYPPLKIKGGRLKAIEYKLKIASAQVKSCILMAGLFANGVTSVSEPVKSRDHTERMLKMFGCRVLDETLNPVRCLLSNGVKAKFHQAGTQPLGCKVSINGRVKLKSPGVIKIPGDISSAGFFIVAGCILPNIKIIIKNVGLNPTRTGVLDILKRMGADIKITENRVQRTEYEPSGNITVKSNGLKGVTISPEEVVRAIDEIPIIMVAACFARGTTIIRGIEELRVKETDRIKSMVTNLQKLGADIDVVSKAKPWTSDVQGLALDILDIIRVNGGRVLHGARVSSFGDHRTAMSMLIAGLAAKGKVTVTGLGCINKSFPGFENLFRKLY